MIGMAIAPTFSAFLHDINFNIVGVHFDRLNSVGLILVIINLASQVVVYFFLPDLPTVEADDDEDTEGNRNDSEWLLMFKCIIRNPHIGVPFLTIFAFNFNWQFIETGLAPASMDALGWNPTQVSWVLGAMAVLVFTGMIFVHKLSSSGVSDYKLLNWGLLTNATGCLGLYLLWYRGVKGWEFASPVYVAAGSFAFLGGPNRSLFSAAVDATPELAGYSGSMQALLSVSGYIAPM